MRSWVRTSSATRWAIRSRRPWRHWSRSWRCRASIRGALSEIRIFYNEDWYKVIGDESRMPDVNLRYCLAVTLHGRPPDVRRRARCGSGWSRRTSWPWAARSHAAAEAASGPLRGPRRSRLPAGRRLPPSRIGTSWAAPRTPMSRDAGPRQGRRTDGDRRRDTRARRCDHANWSIALERAPSVSALIAPDAPEPRVPLSAPGAAERCCRAP